jgi:hypothetical protein
MAILNNNSLIGSSGQGGGYQIERSLRFNRADSAFLSRTAVTPTDGRKATMSFWIKKCDLSTDTNESYRTIFYCGTPNVDGLRIAFARYGGYDNHEFDIGQNNGGSSAHFSLRTTQVFRDTSAFYHFLIRYDSTDATANNRVRIYVNGSEITSFLSRTNAPLNHIPVWQVSGTTLKIGKGRDDVNEHIDMYLADFQFIDGQALDPSAFGEYNLTTGVWQPKRYAGSYGANGFYLPLDIDQIVEGFSTVLYKGTGSTHRITGVGHSPDLIWIKRRNTIGDHALIDIVRGGNKTLASNLTDAEGSQAWSVAFDVDGFTLPTGDALVNGSGTNYVAWCWDAGNSTVTNTSGTISAQVRANTTYGFSIVTYTGTGANATVGHGLGAAPSFIIVKRRNSAADWMCYHQSIGNNNHLILDTTAAAAAGAGAWNATTPTSSVFSIGTYGEVNFNAGTYVAYCFAEVAGFSKFGSYTGTGSAGNSVTLGFKPAFVMVKQTNAAGQSWYMADGTRDTVGSVGLLLEANSSGAEFDTGGSLTFTDTGFTINETGTGFNANGSTYIYAAFADKREAAFWRDFSGNGNNWQPNNLDFNDPVVDTPTRYGIDTGAGGEVRGNYATLNPLSKLNWISQNSTVTPSNGNLEFAVGSAGNMMDATIAVSSGKWYWEVTQSNYILNGIRSTRGIPTGDLTYRYYQNNGQIIYVPYNTTSQTVLTTVATAASGDIIGIALDLDNRTLSWYKNNSLLYTATSIVADEYAPCVGGAAGSSGAFINFGQRPFAYTAPSGFKALCTTNLPEPTIAEGKDYFNAATYTGNNQTLQSIATVGFQPDLIWIKNRNASNHVLVDAVRGRGFHLASNLTNAEATDSSTQGVTAFLSNGFSVQADPASYGSVNDSTEPYVAWNWKANGAGVSNNAGTISSTVSANTTAGFSIVTYTGNGTSGATVGHGLSAQPSMMFVKWRDGADDWCVYNKNLSTSRSLWLNSTSAQLSSAYFGYFWNNTDPTSSVLTLGSNGAVNGSGRTYVAYCFAPVAGYSAFGSYTGNGSSDGPFVHLGFRPRYVLIKLSSGVEFWVVYDSARDAYNLAGRRLLPNASNAEAADTEGLDLISNGFKLRGTSSLFNTNGGNYIYAAFAENPFKYSLAR